MNSKYTLSAIITAATLAATASLALAQGGPLAPPPGPPAPTMKSLDLVEPRIPLVEGASGVTVAFDGKITINQSGSYYLTANLNAYDFGSAITIDAGGVTLDLMGYSIIGATPNPTLYAGIAVTANRSDVRITNGHIISYSTFSEGSFMPAGFELGISFGSGCTNSKVSDISVSGVRSHGIILASDGPGLVEGCTVSTAGGSGIQNSSGSVLGCVVKATVETGIEGSVVANCRVTEAQGGGIFGGVVSNCYAQSTGEAGNGISAWTVENSYGISSGGHGILAQRAVQNCYGNSSTLAASQHGISADGAQVSGSYGTAGGGHGIFASEVSDSTGTSYGSFGLGSCGISATTVNNSRGEGHGSGGGHGINAEVVIGSFGFVATDAGNGINTLICESSSGTRLSPVAGKYGILANRASLCFALNGDSITHRYNMP